MRLARISLIPMQRSLQLNEAASKGNIDAVIFPEETKYLISGLASCASKQRIAPSVNTETFHKEVVR